MKKFFIGFLLIILVLVISVSAFIFLQHKSFSRENPGASFKYTLKLLSQKYTSGVHDKFLSSKPSTKHKKIILQIPKKSVRDIAKFLKENKLITNDTFFVNLVRLKGMDKAIKTGEFEFFTDFTPIQVLEVLKRGKEVQYEVTLPENLTYKEIAERLEKAEITKAKDFIKLCESQEMLKKYGIDASSDRKNYIPTIEGYLYPETYKFKHWTPAEKVFDRLVKKSLSSLKTLSPLIKKSGLTKHEVMTLASIIGKETTTDSERFKVSSVFHNRLKKGMLLQTDPTVIYMVTDRTSTTYHAGIKKSHLEDRTNPYNTYIYKGVPPGPIGNPNYKSIEAVLKPADTSYIFFVSNNDGTHTFTKNLKDHEAAVKRYWKKVRNSKKHK